MVSSQRENHRGWTEWPEPSWSGGWSSVTENSFHQLFLKLADALRSWHLQGVQQWPSNQEDM